MATGPVEKKVKTATAAATIAGAAVAVLNAVLGDSQLLGALHPAAQGAVLLVGTPLAVGWAAWQARHTPRDDPDAHKGRGGRNWYGL